MSTTTVEDIIFEANHLSSDDLLDIKTKKQVHLNDEEAKELNDLLNSLPAGKKTITFRSKFNGKHLITNTHEYVGLIPLKTKQIQIVPRGHPETSMDYQIMFGYTKGLDLNTLQQQEKQIRIGTKPTTPWITFIIKYLYDGISQIERHGLASNYINEIEESQFLKGKVLWEKSFSKGYFPTEKQFLQTSYLTRDILENQILKEALRVALKSFPPNKTGNTVLKNKIFILYNKFQGINKLEDNSPKIIYHSLNQKYKKVIPLCLYIIKNKIPILDSKSQIINNYMHLTDINKLFEEFLIKFLDDHQVKIDSKSYYLEGRNHTTNNNWKYLQTPDIIVENDKKEKIIIDAKNKPNMVHKLELEDIRQMLVYCRFIGLKSTQIVLPFPETLETSFNEKFSFTDIDGNDILINPKSIKLTTDELVESMHDFLIYLHDNFNVDFKSTNPAKCNCRLAEYQKKKNRDDQQTLIRNNNSISKSI